MAMGRVRSPVDPCGGMIMTRARSGFLGRGTHIYKLCVYTFWLWPMGACGCVVLFGGVLMARSASVGLWVRRASRVVGVRWLDTHLHEYGTAIFS